MPMRTMGIILLFVGAYIAFTVVVVSILEALAPWNHFGTRGRPDSREPQDLTPVARSMLTDIGHPPSEVRCVHTYDPRMGWGDLCSASTDSGHLWLWCASSAKACSLLSCEDF